MTNIKDIIVTRCAPAITMKWEECNAQYGPSKKVIFCNLCIGGMANMSTQWHDFHKQQIFKS